MADRGRPIAAHLVSQMQKLRRQGASIRDIARATGCSKVTVFKYTKGSKPPPDARESGS